MRIKTLKLQNIRSYSSQTIAFPHGTILLAGDIGSGKSTILLAIEFALFGSSRTDLPAEFFLRKGLFFETHPTDAREYSRISIHFFVK